MPEKIQVFLPGIRMAMVKSMMVLSSLEQRAAMDLRIWLSMMRTEMAGLTRMTAYIHSLKYGQRMRMEMTA